MPILDIKNLHTVFSTPNGMLSAVNDVSFSLEKGQVLGLVGESGSGKSVTGFSIMNLIDPPGKITQGQLIFNNQNLLALSESEMRQIRGNKIAMIFQDPMMTLNPVLRIDTQIIETIYAHRKVGRSQAKKMAIEALEMMKIPNPEKRLTSYPHQLSGGLRQRIAIAIALIHQPDLLIADEPTTALDVTIQSQILSEVQNLCREYGTAVIWITHDLSLVSGFADDIAVMYAGQIVEKGNSHSVTSSPKHPYSAKLLASLPAYNEQGKPLKQINGMIPSLTNLPKGCSFYNRCDYCDSQCLNKSPLFIEDTKNNTAIRCFHPLTNNIESEYMI